MKRVFTVVILVCGCRTKGLSCWPYVFHPYRARDVDGVFPALRTGIKSFLLSVLSRSVAETAKGRGRNDVAVWKGGFR